MNSRCTSPNRKYRNCTQSDRSSAEIGSIGWLPLVKPVVCERRYAREIQIVYAIRQNTIGIVERSRGTESKLIIAGIPTIDAECILALQCAQRQKNLDLAA